MQAGVLYRVPGHNFTELICVPSLVCGAYLLKQILCWQSLSFNCGRCCPCSAITQKRFWKQFYSTVKMPWLTPVSPPPLAPPQSWVVQSTLNNTWKSQLSTYTGCPGSVQTSRHLYSSACVTTCPGHHGLPKTCQDTYQDILGVWNSPGHSSCPELSTKSGYCGPARHAQCTMLLCKPLHSTVYCTCIQTLQIFMETVFCKWAKCSHSFWTPVYSGLSFPWSSTHKKFLALMRAKSVSMVTEYTVSKHKHNPL